MKKCVRNHPPGLVLREALGGLLRGLADAVEGFGADPAGGAHVIRVRVKRLQALSHLVPRGGAWRRRLLPPCRELKDVFAATRDATILRVLSVAYGYGGALPLPVAPAPDLARAGELVAEASSAVDALGGWRAITWDELVGRAVVSYRGARKALRAAAREGSSDAAFHRLRRRVKRLLYQCEFLGRWARADGLARDLARLGEILGELQDARITEEWLAPQQDAAEWPRLRRLRAKLRRKARRKADKTLASSPREFRRQHAVRRVGTGWDASPPCWLRPTGRASSSEVPESRAHTHPENVS
jgi:hypothetical protein